MNVKRMASRLGVLAITAVLIFSLPAVGEAAKKSDSDIKEAINNRLNPFNDVSISVAAGLVTLGGTVPDETYRQIAVSTAKNMDGVTSVRDNIRVAPKNGTSMGDMMDDTAITAKVKAELLAQQGVNMLGISVNTTNGVVMLTGEVDNADQAKLAGNYASQVSGVKKVDNRLRAKK